MKARKLLTFYVRYYYPLPGKEDKQQVSLGTEEGIKGYKKYRLYRTKSITDPFTSKPLGIDYKDIGRAKITKLKKHSSTVKLKSRKLKDPADGYVFKRKK